MSLIPVKVRDGAGGWVALGGPGPTGPTGPTASIGPTGPTGAIDRAADEVIVGPAQPTTPEADVWYDTAAPDQPPYSPFPTGGTAEQSLTVAADGSLSWAGPNLKLSGGTTTGDVDVTGNVTVGAKLTSPTVAGDVWFNNDITAASVEDRTAYEWEPWNAALNLLPQWWFQPGVAPCMVWRNRYAVLVNMNLSRRGDNNGGLGTDFPFHEWLPVFQNPIPAGWRPPVVLWDTFHAVEVNWQAPLFQCRLQPDGQIYLWAHGNWPWQLNSKIPVYFCFPRPPG